MFTRTIHLFNAFGIPIKIDLSWFLIFILVTWTLAVGLFPQLFPDQALATYWWMGVAGSLGLFISVVLHELGHALVAKRRGMEMRGITLFLFGGVAEMADEPPDPRTEFLVAIAGPIVSVAIAVGAYFMAVAGAAAAWPIPVTGVLLYLGIINGLLVAFNMVPAFPLDGGRVLRSVLWYYKGSLKWATRICSKIGSAFGIVLIVMGVLTFIGGNPIGGMWWFILGLFLRGAAQMSYQQLLMRRALEGESIRRFMKEDVHTVPPSLSVRELVEDYVYRYHHKMYPVVEGGVLKGCVTTRRLSEIPREEWSMHPVADLVDQACEANTIHVGADATEALAKMSQQGASRLMVVENSHLRGVVSLKDMLAFISMKVELEEDEEHRETPMLTAR